jgi:hypothetical protein
MPLAAAYSNPLLDNSSSANTSFGEQFQWRYEIFIFLLVVVLIWKRCYKFIAPLELAPRVSEVIHMALQGLMRCMDILQKYSNYKSLYVSVSLSVFLALSVSLSVLVCVLLRVPVCVRIRQFKYGTMNIYVRHGNYIVDSQVSYEVAQKLEGPLT